MMRLLIADLPANRYNQSYALLVCSPSAAYIPRKNCEGSVGIERRHHIDRRRLACL